MPEDSLFNREVAEMVAKNGPNRIKELVRKGTKFNKESKDNFDFSLGQRKVDILSKELYMSTI